MPLTEFLRMSKGKVDATQQRASTSTDPSFRPPDTDIVELVWENGKIVMHGQSNRARKLPSLNGFHSLVPKAQDARCFNGSKMNKFSTMGSLLADFTLPFPSCETGLDQDVDIMVPWSSYPIEDPLHIDYASDPLHELSGVTLHGHDHTFGLDNPLSSKHENPFKIFSGTGKRTNGGNAHHVSRDSNHDRSSLCAFTRSRLQKLDEGQPSSSSGFTNFSYFSRPIGFARANHLTKDGSKRLENDDKKRSLSSSSNRGDSTLVDQCNGGSQKEKLLKKPTEELVSANEAICREDGAKDKESLDKAYSATMTKAGITGERNIEPVVATSSVGSGNGIERASNESRHDLKRKYCETTESEGPSEELEEESVGVKKSDPGRTSKRSRAAEVHNLSERRRRDRINEKMRALQELIPNCNTEDKASMLDEAIEYLKTLQLQLQVLSMGSGLYMQPMMLPPAMQLIHGPHTPHFTPMGVGMGMGMGMGFGTNMLDVNSCMKMMPFQAPHCPVPSTGPPFHGMPGCSLQAFGLHGQGLSTVFPVLGGPPLKIPAGVNVSVVAGPTEAPHLAPSCSSKDVVPQVIPSNGVSHSVDQGSNQATNKGIEHPALSHFPGSSSSCRSTDA